MVAFDILGYRVYKVDMFPDEQVADMLLKTMLFRWLFYCRPLTNTDWSPDDLKDYTIDWTTSWESLVYAKHLYTYKHTPVTPENMCLIHMHPVYTRACYFTYKRIKSTFDDICKEFILQRYDRQILDLYTSRYNILRNIFEVSIPSIDTVLYPTEYCERLVELNEKKLEQFEYFLEFEDLLFDI